MAEPRLCAAVLFYGTRLDPPEICPAEIETDSTSEFCNAHTED